MDFDENGTIIVPEKIKEDMAIEAIVRSENEGKFTRKEAQKVRSRAE